MTLLRWVIEHRSFARALTPPEEGEICNVDVTARVASRDGVERVDAALGGAGIAHPLAVHPEGHEPVPWIYGKSLGPNTADCRRP